MIATYMYDMVYNIMVNGKTYCVQFLAYYKY